MMKLPKVTCLSHLQVCVKPSCPQAFQKPTSPVRHLLLLKEDNLSTCLKRGSHIVTPLVDTTILSGKLATIHLNPPTRSALRLSVLCWSKQGEWTHWGNRSTLASSEHVRIIWRRSYSTMGPFPEQAKLFRWTLVQVHVCANQALI